MEEAILGLRKRIGNRGALNVLIWNVRLLLKHLQHYTLICHPIHREQEMLFCGPPAREALETNCQTEIIQIQKIFDRCYRDL
jgi:hypothetical protein